VSHRMLTSGHEWLTISPLLYCTFVGLAVFSKAYKEQNSLAVDAEVKAIISENANENDVMIYTDGSVMCKQRSAWAFIARSTGRLFQEASGAFAMKTSNMTMEIMAVTKVYIWLKSQDYTNVCILSD
jgi:hypothetical protein